MNADTLGSGQVKYKSKESGTLSPLSLSHPVYFFFSLSLYFCLFFRLGLPSRVKGNNTSESLVTREDSLRSNFTVLSCVLFSSLLFCSRSSSSAQPRVALTASGLYIYFPLSTSSICQAVRITATCSRDCLEPTVNTRRSQSTR